MKDIIKITELIENEDGSANLMIDISEQATKELIVEGFRTIVDEMKAKVEVLPVEDGFSSNAKQYELTDDEAQLLLLLGFESAIRRGLKAEQ